MKAFDLTMPIDERTPTFPGDPKQEIKQIATIREKGWNEKKLTFNSHFSTHIDAPFHMIENGKKLTDFPIETFIGDAYSLASDAQSERLQKACQKQAVRYLNQLLSGKGPLNGDDRKVSISLMNIIRGYDRKKGKG